MTCATGMNAVAGKCILTINGGEFLGNVYGISRVGTSSSGDVAEVSGIVEVHINGGSIQGYIQGRMDSTAKFTGKCDLYLDSDMDMYRSKTSGFDSVVKK